MAEFDRFSNLAVLPLRCLPITLPGSLSGKPGAGVADSLVIIPDVFGSLWARKLVVRGNTGRIPVVDLGILSQLPPREDVVETKPSDEAPVWLQELGRLPFLNAFDDILIRLPEPPCQRLTFWKLSDLYHSQGRLPLYR